MSKFKVGDKVRVINYGHQLWEIVDGKWVATDMRPDLIGQEGFIADLQHGEYAIDGIKGKHAWYFEDQLELAL